MIFFTVLCNTRAAKPSSQQQQYTFKDLLNMELRWNSDVENVVTAHSFQVSVEVCCTAAVLKERLGNLKLPLPLLNQKNEGIVNSDLLHLSDVGTRGGGRGISSPYSNIASGRADYAPNYYCVLRLKICLWGMRKWFFTSENHFLVTPKWLIRRNQDLHWYR